ncbi:MAG: family 43 glycosylhydrolase [Clostridia bacterium]|nr:family 43 glycosylhydrolase [Clostridia bacterium]
MPQIYNPFLPLDEYIPDGEPHVFGDRVYLYGSHDKENGTSFCMLDYVTYSAPVGDLTDWRYEGVIYSASQDPIYPKYKYMFAPDVVRGNDGSYYLYYSLSNDYPDCSFVISVAKCDTPSGKFEFLGHLRWQDGSLFDYGILFDPAVMNDQGKIRLYYGMWWPFERDFCGKEMYERLYSISRKSPKEIDSYPDGIMGPFTVELCDDMLTVKTAPKRILPRDFAGTEFEGHEFFEASSMRKIGETYYFIYSSFNCNELCYATSLYPDRDFRFGGTIISNGDVGFEGRLPKDRLNRTGNNHGSIEKIGKEWYVFYHRHTTKRELSRQACAERIEISKDGTISQVEMTSCGLNGGPLVARGVFPAIICCNLTNGAMPQGECVDRCLPHIISRGGERFISEVGDSTMIGYKYLDFCGSCKIGVKYRSADSLVNGKIKVLCGSSLVGSIEIAPSKDWKMTFCDVKIDGVFSLYLIYEGKGLIDILEFEIL